MIRYERISAILFGSLLVVGLWGLNNWVVVKDLQTKISEKDVKISELQKSVVGTQELAEMIKSQSGRQAILARANNEAVLGVEAKLSVETPTTTTNSQTYEGIALTVSGAGEPIKVYFEKSKSSAFLGELVSSRWYYYSKLEEGWYSIEYKDGKFGWVESKFFEKQP